MMNLIKYVDFLSSITIFHHYHHDYGMFIMSSVVNLELHKRMARVSCCETVLVVVVSL